MKKSISVFRVYLTDVIVIPVETGVVRLQCRRSIMALPGQGLTLLGRQVTAPGSMYGRETQSITFRFRAA